MNAVDLGPSWTIVLRHAERTVRHFHELVEERVPGLLPEPTAGPVLAALGRLTVEADDRAGRAALLTVLGHAYRRHGLRPEHESIVGNALVATVARHFRAQWRPPLGLCWARAYRRAVRAVAEAAGRAGDGPAWWSAEVVGHDRPVEGVAILTVRPESALPFRPGQAVPVNVDALPGVWRWYSPANTPRPDGTIELHVRAVPAGTVSSVLVQEVRPGDRLRLGPPHGTDLTLDAEPPRDLLLVAGGTGLAPLRALVEQVAAGEPRPVTLIVGSRAFVDLYDAVALDKLQCAYDWLTIRPAFSHDLLATPAEEGDALTVALRHHHPGQEVYVCGPPAMVAGCRLRLLAAGVPAHRIHLPDAH
ncbi:FAD-binding oxidoreductase [Micromonospora echinospora]|uniref:FAD-binding oxidoreductase n=1 Tax=Micromonospora echinospora TaxID=1877 RepID=UPI003A8A66C6